MYKTEQEQFWSGEFGDAYITRNNDDRLLASKTHLFSDVLKQTAPLTRVLEIGANIGLNLKAVKRLIPTVQCTAVEINEKACDILENSDWCDHVIRGSILNTDLVGKFDLVFSFGVLIHINPNELKDVYEKMYKASNRYILVAEYYNPSPLEISYRGHEEKLFKRDFAGEIMDLYNVKLVNYGFVYHKDNLFALDDITWFLLEK